MDKIPFLVINRISPFVYKAEMKRILSFIGTKSSGALPTYFAPGLISLLSDLCSMIWAAQPDTLEHTKMGVKSLVGISIKL